MIMMERHHIVDDGESSSRNTFRQVAQRCRASTAPREVRCRWQPVSLPPLSSSLVLQLKSSMRTLHGHPPYGSRLSAASTWHGCATLIPLMLFVAWISSPDQQKERQ